MNLCLRESPLSSSEDGGLVATDRSMGLTSLLFNLCFDLSSAGNSIVFLSYSSISLELSSIAPSSSSSSFSSDSSDTSSTIRLLIGLKFFRLLRGFWMLVICNWAWPSYWESLSWSPVPRRVVA